MDDPDIYANVEGPWRNPGSAECCSQQFAHEDFSQDIKTRNAAFSVAAADNDEERSVRRSCRGAAVCLALLSFLLLLGLTTMVFLYTQKHSECEKQRTLLLNVHDNLTRERGQFLELQRRTELLSKNHTELLKLVQVWQYFSGSFYQVSATKKTWSESRSDCLQKGADLLVINSKEEQAFANRFKKYMWIGLTDVTSEGSWTWVDGTKMSASYWSSGEPNGKKNENCGDIKNYSTEKSWNDESCSISLFWICEKKLFL